MTSGLPVATAAVKGVAATLAAAKLVMVVDDADREIEAGLFRAGFSHTDVVIMHGLPVDVRVTVWLLGAIRMKPLTNSPAMSTGIDTWVCNVERAPPQTATTAQDVATCGSSDRLGT